MNIGIGDISNGIMCKNINSNSNNISLYKKKKNNYVYC